VTEARVRKVLMVAAALTALAGAAWAQGGGWADKPTGAHPSQWRVVDAKASSTVKSMLAIDTANLAKGPDGKPMAAVVMLMNPPDTSHGAAILGIEMLVAYDCAAGTLRLDSLGVLTDAGMGEPHATGDDVQWSAPTAGSSFEATLKMACGTAALPKGKAYADPAAMRTAWVGGTV
jgi:hypothetical protein